MVRIALKSLRRNPILSALAVGGIGLGIGVSTTFVTTMYTFEGHPIPHKDASLRYVQMDSWDPDRSWDDEDPSRIPDQMTYLDVRGIMASDIPTYKSGMYKALLTVHPDEESQRPYRARVRMCFADFFPMFEIPFMFGGGWDRGADAGPEPVIVIDAETNQRLFGGEDSVGRTVRIEDRDFTIVGVMAPWQPFPKYYDTHNGPFEDIESIFMPFNWVEPMEIRTAGNNSNWKGYDGDEFKDYLNSESTWLQMWVQLDGEQKVQEYQDFLEAYVLEQKKLGRFGRPIDNRLLTVRAWLEEQEVVPDEARSMVIIGLLFLIVSSVNLIGILLGKFLARSPEVGVRRALGASRKSVFMQHLIECEIIGVLGGAVGLALSFGGLRLIESLFEPDFNFILDVNMMLAGLGLALLSGFIAGVYPAWRICRIPPAVHLKVQ
jgi:putative ABC transport system permease protein